MTINQVAGDFQSFANELTPVATAGDFASENPRRSVIAQVWSESGSVMTAGLVAGSGGINCGTFAWLQSDGVTALNSGSGAPTGFKALEMDALISTYLGSYSVNVPQGFPVTLYESGDYWMTAGNSTAAVVGQKVYAKLSDGTTTTGVAAGTISGYVETPFFVKSASLAGDLFIGGL